MQQILRKRVWRNLRQNFLRYFALMAMIIMGMFLIVSLVAAADTVVIRTGEYAKECKVEDGQFTVFVPLSSEQTEKIEEKGVTLEKMFYQDFSIKNKSTIRVFKDRKKINLISFIKGEAAKKSDEIVLERRYCEEHDISVGDTISIGGKDFKVTGIGVTPDYEGPFKNLADSSVDSVSFGIGWVVDDAYESLLKSGKGEKAEEYVYAYRLGDDIAHEKLKNILEDFEFDVDNINDPYFQEYWDETGGIKEEIEDGITELWDGAKELRDGMEELGDHSSDIREGADEILKGYLSEATSSLNKYGFDTELTKYNFEQELQEFAEESDNAIVKLSINQLIKQLKSMKKFADGVTEYTDGVDSAEEGATELADGVEELHKESKDFFDEYLEDTTVHNLEMFIKADENPRIGGAADDQAINKLTGLLAGIVVIILFTYVISVFVTHEIERDSSIIGTLYSLGVKRSDLLTHYLYLPVVVTMLAGVIGMLIGFSNWLITIQLESMLNYYSLPAMKLVHPIYLVIYSVIMPPVVAVIVNCLVISKKLNQPALKLIKKETKPPKNSKVNLSDMGFVRKFQIRQLLRELRSSMTVVFGMFISFLLLMLGLDIYLMCAHISVDNKKDVKFEYMYTYKYPTEEIPKGGIEAYTEEFKMENLGYKMNVSIMGITDDNPYFDVELAHNKSDVVISSAMAQKFALKKGDTFVIENEDSKQNYAFKVKDVTAYSPSFYIFMDIKQMRALFGAGDKYYNVIFSDKDLKIPSGKLYAVTTKGDIETASDVYLGLMWSMIYMMLIVSILVFGVVMYLMMKVMIDRSATNISLLRIFGYRTTEIRKLYIDGNFFVVAIGAAICMPVSKLIMDAIYPSTVANSASAMDLSMPLYYYGIIYVSVLILCFIISRLLMRRIRSVTPAEILRNRE